MVIFIGLVLTQHIGKAMGTGQTGSLPSTVGEVGAAMARAGLGIPRQGQRIPALQR